MTLVDFDGLLIQKCRSSPPLKGFFVELVGVSIKRQLEPLINERFLQPGYIPRISVFMHMAVHNLRIYAYVYVSTYPASSRPLCALTARLEKNYCRQSESCGAFSLENYNCEYCQW